MENPTLKIVRKFLEFLNKRGLENLIDLFADQVDLYIPGDESKAEWLGKRGNRAEVADFFRLLWKNTKPVAAKIDGIFIDKDKAVVTGEFSTTMLPTHKSLHSMFCIQMQIRNREIVKYRLLEDSYAVSQALIR